jgi:hypothetical protein
MTRPVSYGRILVRKYSSPYHANHSGEARHWNLLWFFRWPEDLFVQGNVKHDARPLPLMRKLRSLKNPSPENQTEEGEQESCVLQPYSRESQSKGVSESTDKPETSGLEYSKGVGKEHRPRRRQRAARDLIT